MTDTIFAQASAPGRAGIAVVRISGQQAHAAAAALAGPLGAARTAALRWLVHPATGEKLDQALVLPFAAPASFTGEDTVELHLHGSPAGVRTVLAALGAQPGLRPAEPGEFTRRALLGNRLDLARVEGLGDLIAAETTAQHRQAIALMQGALARLAEGWRHHLLHSLAFVEATIDFADEELPPDLLEQITDELALTVAAIDAEVAGARIAERVREGFEVALVGRPNVGKSTLLNALAGRDAALTSEIAGTTRDVIEVRVDLGGLALTILDMAGIREAGETIEHMGVARARARAAGADLRLFLVDDPSDTGLARSRLRSGRPPRPVQGRPSPPDRRPRRLRNHRAGPRRAARTDREHASRPGRLRRNPVARAPAIRCPGRRRRRRRRLARTAPPRPAGGTCRRRPAPRPQGA